MASTLDISLMSRAQQFMDRFTASRAERDSRRQEKAGAALLQHMEPRLLDDIGVASVDVPSEGKPLARLNPLIVAVNLYTTPRSGR